MQQLRIIYIRYSEQHWRHCPTLRISFQNFKFQLSPDKPAPNVKDGFTGFTRTPKPFYIKLFKRN